MGENEYTAKMRRSVRDAWVQALRSGEYQQTQGTLQDRDGSCCLGVLCEVAILDGLKLNVRRFGEMTVDAVGHEFERTDTSFDESIGTLPDAVIEWSGLVAGDKNNPLLGSRPAATWNDDHGRSFEYIADLIEKHVEPLDEPDGSDDPAS